MKVYEAGILCWGKFTQDVWEKKFAEHNYDKNLLKINYFNNKISYHLKYKKCDILFTNYIDEDLVKKVSAEVIIIPTSGADLSKLKMSEKPLIITQSELLADSVAEHALAFILFFYRQLKSAAKDYDDREWEQTKYFNSVQQVKDKNIAILGCGNVGRGIAKRLSGFSCNIYGFDKYLKTSDYFNKIYDIEELSGLVSTIDILIIALPFTTETEGLINNSILQKMKKSSLLINISRGKIINEADLIHALNTGTISGACLDVVSEEPLPKDNPLWKASNIFITPHIAGNINLFSDRIIDNSVKTIIKTVSQK